MFALARLACFIAVAEELHFGRAAERLHMTQPPLSRQIQQLESELGVQLIDRTTRVVTLTPAGVALLPDARRIMHLAERAALNVKRAPAGEMGTVVVGFTATSAVSVLPRLLEKVREKLPDVTLDLRELPTAAQVEALLAGELDLGLARPHFKRPGLASRPLLHEQLVAALPAAHPLARLQRPLTLSDIDGHDLIMYSPVDSRYFHELLVSAFAASGVTPRYVQYVSQVHTMLALVGSATGIAVVPASAAHLHSDAVVFRSIAAIRSHPVKLDAIWRADRTTPALRRLLRDVLPPREWINDDRTLQAVGTTAVSGVPHCSRRRNA
ncbi:LysR family transcriptional regulator [Mycobacterium dioxanotrophicus]|uniref:Probable hydrogen peroxide-inducible genes activator n=1 Tax=Mycobacterium dioxanotrophicus TaxID=482462 RepID=A0A1Y0C6W7_9MYCO|nr:LysR substrate-binding domain-containing protein [Mycobacterium dioxanotrophicus]ART70806.1 LysR family transcriptional regulator [Mycobacterium dioxanotrophicus]